MSWLWPLLCGWLMHWWYARLAPGVRQSWLSWRDHRHALRAMRRDDGHE